MINNNWFKLNQFTQYQLHYYQQRQPEYQQITIEGITYNKFLRPLWQGTESIVYKGQNIQTKEIVAIKEYKSRNQNELKAIQEIQKKNYSHIIGIKGVHDDQNSYPIVVIEFAPQEFYLFMVSLEYQNLSYEEKTKYFLQMVQGVEQLHQLGLFHRDLKPENFVYIKDSCNKITIKLIDFGLVQETSNKMTKTSQVGTPYYMAPEVLENQNGFYDKSVDIWSLGAIWYEILTDNTFFQGIFHYFYQIKFIEYLNYNSQQEIFYNIKFCQQPQIDKHIWDNHKIQQKEKDFIKRMLNKVSFKRISLKEVLAAYNPQEIIKIPYKPPQLRIQLPQQPILPPQQPIQPPQQPIQLPQQQPRPSEEPQRDNKGRDQQTIQDEIKKQMDKEVEQMMIEFEIKKQDEMKQMKREIERKLEQKFGAQQQNIENQLKQKYEEQIKQKQKELQEFRVQQEKAHQYEKDQQQLAQIKIQQEVQFQNEMEWFKKQKEEEQKKELEKIQQKAQLEKIQEIDQYLKIQEERLIRLSNFQICISLMLRYQKLIYYSISQIIEQNNRIVQK